MRREVVACMFCGYDAKRTAKGIDTDTYECTKCGKSYMIDWEFDMSEELPVLQLRAKVVSPKVEPQTRLEVEFSFTNTSDESITIMRPGDGSSRGMRPPKVNVIVYRAGAKKWESYDPSRLMGACGMINPLTESDFLTIGAGETVNVTGWFHLPVAEHLGEHFIEAVYENDPTMRADMLGAATPELMERMRKSYKCVVKSNMVKIDVVRSIH